jgi:hypothetical protein
MQFKLAIQGMGWIGKRDDVDVGRGKWKGYTVLARARGLSPLSLCVYVCVCVCARLQCPVSSVQSGSVSPFSSSYVQAVHR